MPRPKPNTSPTRLLPPAGGDLGSHFPDALGVGLLDLRLQDVSLVVALGLHDFRLRKARHPLRLGLRLGGNDLPLRLPTGDLRFRRLLLQLCLPAGSLNGSLALLLSRAVLGLALGLGSLDHSVCLDHPGLEGDGM